MQGIMYVYILYISQWHKLTESLYVIAQQPPIVLPFEAAAGDAKMAAPVAPKRVKVEPGITPEPREPDSCPVSWFGVSI